MAMKAYCGNVAAEPKDKPARGPVESISGPCESVKLDQILSEDVELKVSYKIPDCEAIKYVSDKTTGMEAPTDQNYIPKTGGLGLKRKLESESKERMAGGSATLPAKKAKTLAEKRDQLQDDIMRYGVAAIEKMYPRQAPFDQQLKKMSPLKGVRGSPVKMKPKPSGLDFEEVDVRKILRPLSHAKYIKEPDYDYMVYINRREGLVPLASLCKEDTKSVLSNNVKLLKGRNVRLGKPHIFVKDSGRLVAVGGSRNPQGSGIHVVRTPKLVKIMPMEKMLPFEMDAEFADFAASAIPDLSKMSKKIDIRDLKRINRMKALENRDLNTVLKEEKKSIVTHLLEKFGKVPIQDEDQEAPKDQEVPEVQDVVPIGDTTEMEIVAQDQEESETAKDFGLGFDNKVHNEWSDAKTGGKMPIDINDDKPIVSEVFKMAMETKRINNSISGVDICDVPECYCKSQEDSSVLVSKSTTPQTTSGAATPKETSSATKDKSKTAKNLKKVKRALKTLGVNFLHFDEENQGNQAGNASVCDRDHCKLGCVCDSITGKNSIAPVHCGKVECMFDCTCSKDALRLTAAQDHHHKIGIAAEGLRSFKRSAMAQEELKFSNTIVAAGHDLLMIGAGSSGRQKRERKVPSRYQDTDAFFDSATGLPATSSQKAAAVLMLDDDNLSTSAGLLPSSMTLSGGSISARRLTQESLKHEKIKKCTVIMPRLDLNLEDLKPWCMYHNVHGCPCAKYRNPLEYAPDVNASRNVAKRSLGGHFKTKKRVENEVSFEVIEVNEGPKNVSWAGMCADFPHDPNEHSARTFGHSSKGSLKKATKYPQKVVIIPPASKVIKKEFKPEALGPSPKITNVKSLKKAEKRQKSDEPGLLKKGSINDVMIRDRYQKVPKGTKNNPNIINPKPVTCQIDEFRDFNLYHKAKGSFMFVHWIIMRELIRHKKIKVWAHVRPRQLSLLVTWSDEFCYVTDAVDIHSDIAFMDKSHPMFDIMKNTPKDLPDSTHVALTHNGIGWEVAGLSYNPPKEGKENGPNADNEIISKAVSNRKVQPTVTYPSPPSNETKEAAPMSKLNKPLEVMVDTLVNVQKLPKGVNLVTMMRQGSQQPIQVKLPTTRADQNWVTIRVDTKESAVKCPDTDLALKVNVLKQAVNMAAREEKTIRIPIKTADETAKSGIYAVPGLDTHVFVGPFACVEDADDIAAPEQDADEDPDEIVCLSETPKAKPNPMPKPKQLPKINFASLRQEAVMGQVPQKIVQDEFVGDPDIVEDPQDIEDRNLHPDRKSMDYINPSKNPHGRVVYTPDPERANFYFSSGDGVQSILVDNHGSVSMFIGKDIVSFMHPKFDNHEVICENVFKAKLWFQYHDNEVNLEQVKKPKAKSLSIKPLSDLIDHSKSPPNTEDQVEIQPPPEERVINGRRFVCHQVVHNGKQGVALVFDRRHHADMRKLYHRLNQILASNGLKKVTDCIQILNRARDEIQRLEHLDQALTLQKKELMVARQELFKDFSEKLNWLPNTTDKKKAVLDLKEGLKNIKENKILVGNNPNRWDETIMVRTDPNSKLHPNENERQNFQKELQNVSNSSQATVVPMPGNASGITPYSDITGLQTVRKDGKVLRPMNAFMLWTKEKRKELIANGMDGATVSKILAEKWKSMTPEEQSPFYEESERLKNLHLVQHPNYKYSPKHKRIGMKKSVAKLDPIPHQHQPIMGTPVPDMIPLPNGTDNVVLMDTSHEAPEGPNEPLVILEDPETINQPSQQYQSEATFNPHEVVELD